VLSAQLADFRLSLVPLFAIYVLMVHFLLKLEQVSALDALQEDSQALVQQHVLNVLL
jgi:hypothetical protein